MGTDIHMAAEVRRNGKWELVKDQIFKNPWFKEGEKNWGEYDKYPFTNIPYDIRCYSVFAMLADIRNYGHSETINPISEPKGYPSDIRTQC